jgi:hypothetical protein
MSRRRGKSLQSLPECSKLPTHLVYLASLEVLLFNEFVAQSFLAELEL